jgi:hypothetical protein
MVSLLVWRRQILVMPLLGLLTVPAKYSETRNHWRRETRRYSVEEWTR